MPDKDSLVAKTFMVCGVLLEKDDKYLLIQEKKTVAYGLWNLPGGRVEKGETLEQAAVREAKEECGFDVKLGDEILILHPSVELPVLHVYKAEITGGLLKYPEDEILDAKWFTLEQINAMKDKLRTPEYILGAIDKAKHT